VWPLIIGKFIGNFYGLSDSTTQSIPPDPAHTKAVYLPFGLIILLSLVIFVGFIYSNFSLYASP